MKSKKQKRLLLCFCCAMMMAAVPAGFAACGDPEGSTTGTQNQYGEAGVYYCDVAGEEYVVSLNGASFTFVLGSDSVAGMYSYDGTTMSLVFEGDSVATTATLQDGVLSFTYGGTAYSFLKKVNYTVTYDVAGGSAVAAKTVVNGKTLAKPADPTKAGYNFIGWYKDAAFTQPFAFNAEAVTGNLTLYARFEAVVVGQNEFAVSFNVDGATDVYAQAKTIGGVAYNLPTPSKDGATFAGWWMSDKEKADELTCEYKGQTLNENTTLYAVWTGAAPAVSVAADGINWTGVGINKSYSVTITAPDNTTVTESTGETKLAYDFASKAAGEYKVEVTVDGQTGKAVYVNKALDTVSLIKVADPSVLVWNAVKGAEKYIVEFECGDERHQHEAFDNGASTYFNFVNCTVPKTGLSFTIKAVAAGRVASTSAVYTYTRNLEAVTDLTVDAENDQVIWSPVENATSYEVEVTIGEATYVVNVGAETSYSLKYDTGNMTIKVTALADGYNSTQSEAVAYNKAKLVAPDDIKLNGTTLTWTADAMAASYNVKVGDQTLTAATNSIDLSQTPYVSGQNAYEVSVQAVAATAANSSTYSDPIVINYAGVSGVTYADGYVMWDQVVGATGYGVKVNDGIEFKVGAGVSYREITFDQAGVNTIYVRHYDKDGIPTANYTAIDVTAYALRFDVDGAETGVRTQYKAVGDPVVLPEPTFEGHDFSGWYNVRGGADYNGKEWTSNVFNASGNVTLYAYWLAKEYTVALDIDDGDATLEETTVKRRYGDAYTLPKLVSNDEAKVFGGWYTAPNGAGELVADENGQYNGTWFVTQEKIYANWIEMLVFSEINGGSEYAVKKGADIALFDTVKIPATYKGKDVTKIAAGAFEYSTKVKKILIPDTLTEISLGEGGAEATGTAFRGCTALEAFEVYCAHTDGHDDSVASTYETKDGMLLYNNPYEQYKEIVFVPQAHEQLKLGVLRIPEGVERIPANIFKSSRFAKVILPATLKVIENRAFYNNSLLTEIEFTETPAGQTPVPLDLKEAAFRACYGLKEVTLPSRLNSLDTNASTDTFYNCTNLTKIHIQGDGGKYTSSDGLLLTDNGTKLVYCPVNRDGVVTIPETVQIIGERVFEYANSQANRDLTSIEIPGSVKRIEANAFLNSPIRTVTFKGTKEEAEAGYTLDICESAFYGCNKLTSVVLPANLNKLEKDAFGNTTSLTEVTLDCSGNAQLAAAAFGATGGAVTKLTIGADAPYFDIASIFSSAKLTDLTIDPANKSFAKDANGIIYNYAMTKVAFYPSNVSITEYTAPSTLTEIGESVFKNKTTITTVNIGPSVQVIAKDAFKGCTALTTLNFTGTRTAEQTLKIGDSAFANTKLSMAGGVALPVGLTEIGENAFASTKMTSVTLPAGLTKIGGGAFAGVSTITSVEFPTSLTEIGARAFASTGLTAVTLPEGLTAVGESAFAGAPVVTFHISSTITDYGTLAGIESLTTVTVAETNASYSAVGGVLYNKAGTKIILCPANCGGDAEGKLEIASTITEIGANAFQGNKKIKQITFAAGGNYSNLTIGEDAFYGSVIEKVVLPEGFQTIEIGLFKGCASLKEVVIPTSVTKIKANAFSNCTQLTALTFTDIDSPVDATHPALEFDSELPSDSSGSSGLPGLIMPGRPGASTKSYGNMFDGCTSLTTFKFPARTTKLANNMFKSCTNLVSVTHIPSAVTEIPEGTFYGLAKLETVTFADIESSELKTVGKNAFANTKALTSFRLPDSVTTITAGTLGSGGSFTGMAMQTFYVPASMTSLGTFLAGTNVVNVVFATGDNSKLTTIPSGAFKGCKQLVTIQIPASVTTLGTTSNTPTGSSGGVFENCTSLTSVTFEAGSKLAEIASSAFGRDADSTSNSAPNLTTVNIPESSSPTGIKLYPGIFAGSTTITTVTLSKSVTLIDNAFSYCTSITSLTIAPENEIYETNGAAIVTKEGVTPSTYVCNFGPVTATEIGFAGRTTIATEAFKGQTAITKIIIPASVTSIGNYAFYNCTSLAEVVFEPRTTPITIGSYAFAGCTSLKQIELPALTTADGTGSVLNTYMFYKSTALEKVILPEGITEIGGYAFDYCSALKTVQVREEGVVIGNANEVTLPKTVAKLGAYAFRYAGIEKITMPESLTTLFGSSVSSTTANFQGCTSLAYVDLNNVKAIGYSAFEGCTALTSIDLSNVERMGRAAFKGCGLTEVIVPALPATDLDAGGSSATSIFENCTKLTKVTLHESMSVIAQAMFKGCTALETVTLGVGVKKINYYAFENSGLKRIDLTNVTTIQMGAFRGCAKLETIGSLGNSLTKIDREVFKGCAALTTVNVPTALTEIGEMAFDGSGITAFDMSNVTIIGVYAFRGTAITTANLSKLTQSSYYDNTSRGGSNKEKYFDGLGDGVFEDCAKLTSVILPAELATIGRNAFKGTTSLKTIMLFDGTNYIGMDGVATIPATVTGLKTSSFEKVNKVATTDANTFQGSGITTVEFLGAITEIGPSAFEGCANLSSVIFSKGVANTAFSNAKAAFKDCTALKEFGIPSNVTSLAANMFNGSGLETVSISGSVASIDETTFANCANLKSFEVAADNLNYKVGTDGGLYTTDDELVCALPTATA